MGKNTKFDRCIFCFSPLDEGGKCPECGYEDGLCDPPIWWLAPGTVLKGRYITGRHLSDTSTEITYLGWDLRQDSKVEIVEYYPEGWVTRDITHSALVACIPGREEQMDAGCQAFFEKARLFYNCVSRVENLMMDFFLRNNTCYYVRNIRKDTTL